MNYAQLLGQLQNLSPEQLQQEVAWAGDEQGGKVTSVWILEEDYINPSGDGWESISVYADDPDYDVEDLKDDGVKPKGTVILLVD